MQMDSWQELANPRDLTKIFTTPEYAGLALAARVGGLALSSAWRCRASWRACRTAPKTNPVEEFDFEEDTGAADHSRYTWANAAYAMAVNINRSFKLYGWCSRIRGVESGGAVEGLPAHTFPTDDGGVDMKCPTEIAISDRREAELAKNGFMPLLHRKNTDFAAFIGAQSLQKPAEYDDPDATANANLRRGCRTCSPACRFAHYLKCIVRDKIGSFKERDDMQRWLQNWIMNYVDGDPAHSSEDDQGAEAAGRGRGRGRGGRGQPGLLHLEVLPAAALPARRADGVAAAGVEAAVGEGAVADVRVSAVRSARTTVSVDCNGCSTKERSYGSRHVSEDWRHQGRIEGLPSTRTRSTCCRGPGACPTPAASGTAAAAAPARRTFSDLNFMHALDKASPVLMKACAIGDHYDEATLVSRKAGKGQQEYLIIKMKDVFITSVQPSGSARAPDGERLDCSSATSIWSTSRRSRTASLDAGVHFIYDIKKNVDA